MRQPLGSQRWVARAAYLIHSGSMMHNASPPTRRADGNSNERNAAREIIMVRDTGKVQPLGHTPVLTSTHLGWNGYLLEQHRMPPSEPCEVVWLQDVVLVQQGSPVTVEYKDGPDFVPRRILPGHVSLRPSRACTAARCQQPAELLLMALEPGFLSRVCQEAESVNGLDLTLQFGIEDRFVEGVCLALRDEVRQGGKSGQLYSESLASGLALHLATRYTRQGARFFNNKDRLPSRKVRLAMEYIQERLSQDMALKDIAASVHLSPFHFARLFKRATGLSPHQYVIRQRVERARQLLLRDGAPLATIAEQVGFYDQSHLTLHFKRVCGLTPKAFAEQSLPCQIVKPAELPTVSAPAIVSRADNPASAWSDSPA
jgi:AraC family transcriptional regulator